MSLQISIRELGDVTVVDLCGKSTIDSGSESLSRRLKQLIADGVYKLLLNLEDLSQVDSSGVGVIIDTVVRVRNRGGDLKLLCPQGRVLEVLRVLRLTKIVACFEDETEALTSFQPRSHAAAL
jgi:anti-sigma B factor antagonist